MTCPHASTTTLRWLYGDLDDDGHTAHIAGCADCQAACEAHLDVLGAMPAAPVTRPAPRRRLLPAAIALAAAAVALFALWPAPPPVPADTPPQASIDARLDAIDDALVSLQLELALDPEVL